MANPSWLERLFAGPEWAWLWLIVRVWVGYQWFTAGWEKIHNPAWISGQALKGFWTRAVVTEPTAVIHYDWYRRFIEYMLRTGQYTWFAKLVMVGETAVGVALILGFLTGIAAFIGGFMNFNYMMAGTTSTNPVLFTLAILLILAWRIAGYWGLDRWVLPALGARSKSAVR